MGHFVLEGLYQLEQGESSLCVVARDTRRSGPVLMSAAVAGARAAGGRVINLGVTPTPTALKVAQMAGAGTAAVLSASHNGEEYNGLKLTLGCDKPFGEQVDTITDRYWGQVGSGLTIPLNGDPGVERPELREQYAAAVVEDIEREFGELPLAGKIFVVDAANGAAMRMTPDILRRLGAQVEEYGCDEAGAINDGCGATELQGVKDYLAARPDLVSNPKFIGALANDGDADRLMGVGVSIIAGTMTFHELEGNRVMELQAQGQPGIVGTDYTNDGMVERLRGQDIGFEYCENGDVNVTAALRRRQASNGPGVGSSPAIM